MEKQLYIVYDNQITYDSYGTREKNSAIAYTHAFSQEEAIKNICYKHKIKNKYNTYNYYFDSKTSHCIKAITPEEYKQTKNEDFIIYFPYYLISKKDLEKLERG